MKKALLIIDVQNDYFPGGKCRLFRPEEALETIKGLCNYFRERNLPVIYIQHLGDPQAAFFVPETDGARINREIEPLHTETVIIKHTPNSFFETDLHEELVKKGVEELVVCGMMTHMCIDTTVRAAKDYGYRVTLISDGCATKDLEWNGERIPAGTVQNVFLASLQNRFADILSSAEFHRLQEGFS